MRTDLAFRRLLIAGIALVAVVATAFVAGSARADNQPPVVTVGSTSDPTGAVTASGTAGSDGQANACVNGQHSGTRPSSTAPTGAADVNDSSCTSGGASTTGTGNGSQASAHGRTVSSSTGEKHMGGSQGSRASRSSLAVDAGNARGVTITHVKYITTQVRTRRRLLLIVTLRDLQGRLIRDAIVVVRPLPDAKHTIASTQAGFSNAVGQARLAVPIAARMLGAHLQFLIGARTPKAHTVTLGSVRIPVKKPSLSAATG